jgi:hypothetical protein
MSLLLLLLLLLLSQCRAQHAGLTWQGTHVFDCSLFLMWNLFSKTNRLLLLQSAT